MYSEHDGTHMPPVIYYMDGVMSSTGECDDIYSGSDGRQNGFQVRYRACVVIYTVCVTSYIVDMMS